MTEMPKHLAHEPLGGGEFLLRPVGSHTIFTPESFSEEQQLYFNSAEEFSFHEVLPRVVDIEAKKPGVLREVMKKAGDVGFMSVDIPEKYGGLGGDKATSMLMTQTLSCVGSFAVSIGAHTGIGTLPIVYFGTDELKQRYLPKLATGEWIAAYALTEPESGSDALAARTTAKLDGGGRHYVLNGTKQFITNAAIADVFTVFAQIDGDKFTAFVVDRDTPGLEIGPEEHKLGIRGSSTCQVIFEDCKVPVDNVLGEIGRGHKIAFNILNVGRWKLGVGSIGAAHECLRHGARHAAERKQFGRRIGDFGLVRNKLARMATLVYVGESMAYRTAGLIDRRVHDLPEDADRDSATVDVIEEYTVEASILKVFGSEVFDYASDEALQIFGGYGYLEDYPAERFFRDSRINRIFEGTNEINRLIVTATLLKRALKGQLGLFEAADKVSQELTGEATPAAGMGAEGLLAQERNQVEACKSVLVYVLSFVGRKLGEELKERQLVLGNLADGVIDIYAMDSCIARTLQYVQERGEQAAGLPMAMTRLFCTTTHERVFDACREILMWLAEGDEFCSELEAVDRIYHKVPVDVLSLKDRIARATLEQGGYTLRD